MAAVWWNRNLRKKGASAQGLTGVLGRTERTNRSEKEDVKVTTMRNTKRSDNGLYVLAFLISALFTAYGASAGEVPRATPERMIQVKAFGQDMPAPVVTAVAIRKKGDLLAAGGDDHHIRIWHLATGRLVQTLKAHTDWVRSVAFSPDGTTLASGGADGRVLLWAIADVETPVVLDELPSAVSQVKYVSGGKGLLVAGFGFDMGLYSVASKKKSRTFTCHCADIRAVAVSPDDQLVAVAGRSGVIRVWALATAQEVWSQHAHRMRIRDMEFTEDAKRLVSASEDRAVRIWNAKTGAAEGALPRQHGKVLAISLLGNNHVAVAGSDNTLQFWELRGKKPLARLIGHTGSVSALTSLGNVLASGSFDTTIGIWDLSQPPTIMTKREARLTSELNR